MSDFYDDDSAKLNARSETLLSRINEKCKEVSPLFMEIGKMREELAIIYEELHRRGEVPKYEPPISNDEKEKPIVG